MSKIRDEASKTSQSISGKNRFINGSMHIWQRGSSVTAPAGTLFFGPDRFGFQTTTVGSTASLFDGLANADMAVTGQRIAMKLVAAGTPGVALITQRIEGVNCNDFVGRKITFSAWVFSELALSNLNWLFNTANAQDNFGGGATTQASGVFQSIPAQTWTKVTFTVTGNNTCPKGTSVEMRGMDLSGGKAFYTTGWQLELGEVPSTFEYELLSVTLAKCQRYFAVQSSGTKETLYKKLSWNSNAVRLPVTMRTIPTINISNQSNLGDTAGITLNALTDRFFYSFSNGNEGAVEVNWTAQAEML